MQGKTHRGPQYLSEVACTIFIVYGFGSRREAETPATNNVSLRIRGAAIFFKLLFEILTLCF